MKRMFDETTVREADAKAALTEEPGVEYGSIDVVNIRLVKEPSIMSNTPIRSDVDAVNVVTEYLSGFDREVFGILHLSSRGTPISFNVASVGTLTESLVSPREIFKTAILSNASSFIAFHCHPSGCPEPSQTDLITTQRLQKAGEIMNIKLIDHIIVGCGTGESISFAAKGMMSPDFNMEAAVNEPNVLAGLNKDWQSIKDAPRKSPERLKLKERREVFER